MSALKVFQSGEDTELHPAVIQESSKSLPLGSLFIGSQDYCLWSTFFHSSCLRLTWYFPHRATIRLVGVSSAIRGHLIIQIHSLIKTRTMLACLVITKQGVSNCPNSLHPSIKTRTYFPRQEHNSRLSNDQQVRNASSFLHTALVIKTRTLENTMSACLEVPQWPWGGVCSTTSVEDTSIVRIYVAAP